MCCELFHRASLFKNYILQNANDSLRKELYYNQNRLHGIAVFMGYDDIHDLEEMISTEPHFWNAHFIDKAKEIYNRRRRDLLISQRDQAVQCEFHPLRTEENPTRTDDLNENNLNENKSRESLLFKSTENHRKNTSWVNLVSLISITAS